MMAYCGDTLENCINIKLKKYDGAYLTELPQWICYFVFQCGKISKRLDAKLPLKVSLSRADSAKLDVKNYCNLAAYSADGNIKKSFDGTFIFNLSKEVVNE